LNLSKNLLTSKSAKKIATFLEKMDSSDSMEHLILDGNVKVQNQGLNDLCYGLLNRAAELNNSMTVVEDIMMPLLTFSMANCGITDQGFHNFTKKIEELNHKFDPTSMLENNLVKREPTKDFYRGGMAINFADNELSSLSLVSLTATFKTFRGFRSVNLSRMGNFKSQTGKEEHVHVHDGHAHVHHKPDKNEQISVLLAKQLAYNTTLTHFDLTGNEFSSKTIVEFLRAIKFNQTLQELKLTINQETAKELPENGKQIKNYNPYHLSCQYNFFLKY
jgi:hypothetical protein